jgi:hypothetical protein
MKYVNIDINEIKRVFFLIEKINDVFHQEENFMDQKLMKKFANENYSEIHELYYKIIWNWLPKDVQEEIIGDN